MNNTGYIAIGVLMFILLIVVIVLWRRKKDDEEEDMDQQDYSQMNYLNPHHFQQNPMQPQQVMNPIQNQMQTYNTPQPQMNQYQLQQQVQPRLCFMHNTPIRYDVCEYCIASSDTVPVNQPTQKKKVGRRKK